MQERGGGEFPIHHHVVGEAGTERADGAPQEDLARPVFTLSRPVGFDIEGERQAGSHHTDQGQVMTVAGNLSSVIAVGAAELASGLLAAPHGGAIHGQADEGTVVKGLVTFGLAQGTALRRYGWERRASAR